MTAGRRERRPPLAAPADAEPRLGRAEPVARQATGRRESRRLPPAGGPDFLWGIRGTVQRRQWRRLGRTALIALALVSWLSAWVSGQGETVVLVTPLTIRGSLGPGGQSPVSAAETIVTRLDEQFTALRQPGFELRIGAPSLDRSIPSTEQVRWYPAAPELRLRVRRGWWWTTTGSPTASQVWPQTVMQQGYWRLLGRKTVVLSGTILAADGKLMLQTELNGRSLHSDIIEGRDWRYGINPVAEALLMEQAPLAAAVFYLRQARFESAESALGLVEERTVQVPALYVAALRTFISQTAHGGVLAPWRGYEALDWTGSIRTSHGWRRLIALHWPGTARQRRFESGVCLLAAAQSLEAESLSMSDELARVAHRLVPRDPSARLLLGYASMRQSRLREAYDLTEPLAVRWPAASPNHAALLHQEILRRLQAPTRLIAEWEGTAFPKAPGDPVLLNNRGVWSWYRGATQSAKSSWTLAEEARPRRAVVLENRAVLAAREDDLLAAGTAFQLARTRTGHLASTWLHPARFLFDRGDYHAAATLLEEGAARNPDAYELALQGAYVRAAAGDGDAALRSLEALTTANIPEARYWLYRGHVAYLHGDLAAAAAAYTASEAAQERSGIATYGRGHACFLQARHAEAAEAFATFVARVPEHTRARLFYYLCLQKLGDPHAESMLREVARAEDRVWMRGVIGLYLGESTPEEVRTAAYQEAHISSTEQSRRACTVEYHIAQVLLKSAPQESAAALANCLATGLTHHYEYQAAVRLAQGSP